MYIGTNVDRLKYNILMKKSLMLGVLQPRLVSPNISCIRQMLVFN